MLILKFLSSFSRKFSLSSRFRPTTYQAASVLSPHTTHPVDAQPQDFCARINHARAAHHARLTVNSEEILASLLEALGNGRSEATRGQLFDATAALAQSFALHGGEDLQDSDAAPTTSAGGSAATGRGLDGIPATLKKGLPAIARAVLEVLDCPVRRAYTWKERKAALETITSLATLAELRGTHGPLGEHRAKLIQGASRGKHDSVAAVREAAIESLLALEATQADEGKPETRRPFSAPAAGVGRFAAEMARKVRKEEGGAGNGTGTLIKSKTLDSIVRKAERAKVAAAAEAPQHKTERDREPPEGDMRNRRKREEREQVKAADTLVPVDRTPPASSVDQEPPPVAANGKQQAPSQAARENLEIPFPSSLDGRASEQNNSGHHHHNAADRRESTPLTPENSNPRELGGVVREPPEHVGRQSSEENISTAQQTNDNAAEPEEKDRRVPMPPRTSAGSGAKRAPAEVEESAAETRLPRVQLSQSVRVVPQLQEAKRLTAASGDPAGAVEKLGSSPLPAPMHGGVQVDTLRLLQHLDSKTDKITSVLDGLDRRLHGVERTLVVRFGLDCVELFSRGCSPTTHLVHCIVHKPPPPLSWCESNFGPVDCTTGLYIFGGALSCGIMAVLFTNPCPVQTE